MTKEIILSCLKEGNFTLHSGQKSKYLFDTRSPLSKYGDGAVSGKKAQKYNWELITKLKEKTNVPVIGCSVWDYEDIQKLYDMKCDAVAFGSIFLRYPWRPTIFIRRRENENKNIHR